MLQLIAYHVRLILHLLRSCTDKQVWRGSERSLCMCTASYKIFTRTRESDPWIGGKRSRRERVLCDKGRNKLISEKINEGIVNKN